MGVRVVALADASFVPAPVVKIVFGGKSEVVVTHLQCVSGGCVHFFAVLKRRAARHTQHLPPPQQSHALQRSMCARTSHVTRKPLHVIRYKSHVTRHTSHVTHHTSHVTRHTSCATCSACSRLFAYTSRVTRHTSNVTQCPVSHVKCIILSYVNLLPLLAPSSCAAAAAATRAAHALDPKHWHPSPNNQFNLRFKYGLNRRSCTCCRCGTWWGWLLCG